MEEADDPVDSDGKFLSPDRVGSGNIVTHACALHDFDTLRGIYTPVNFVCVCGGGVYCFHVCLSVCPSEHVSPCVRP